MANPQEFVALGTSPVPGGKPAGNTEYRYDCSEWDLLKGEIDLLQSVSGQQPSWNKVQKYVQTILSEKCKDIAVASYGAYALLQTDGYAGLAAGLELIKGILTAHWDGAFPIKPKGRENALDWLGERAMEVVDKMPTASESDRAVLTACIAALDGLNAVMKEKGCSEMSKVGPSLHSKVNGIPAAPVPGQEPPPSTGDSPATGAPARPAEIDSPDRAREAITKAAEYLKRASATDPVPFRLARLLAWSDLASIDRADDGKTTISGGDPAMAQGWEQALKKKEFQRVLDEAEARFATDRLWLDTQFFAVRAMEGLGSTYDAARRAIADEVAAFVRRVPDVLASKFDSGTPFAGPSTSTWITNELLPPAPSASGAGSAKLDAVASEAKKLASRNRLQEAMQLMQKEMQAAPQGRERFLWRLALARVLVDGGKAQLAAPQLESLDKEIQRYSLEEWETSLSVEVVKLLWQCYSSLSSDKAAAAYERLCRLDLTAAMALDKR